MHMATLREFGLVAKAIDSSPRSEHAMYLAMRPLRAARRWYWAKSLGRSLYKFGWSRDNFGQDAAWMAGVAVQVTVKTRPSFWSWWNGFCSFVLAVLSPYRRNDDNHFLRLQPQLEILPEHTLDSNCRYEQDRVVPSGP